LLKINYKLKNFIKNIVNQKQSNLKPSKRKIKNLIKLKKLKLNFKVQKIMMN